MKYVLPALIMMTTAAAAEPITLTELIATVQSHMNRHVEVTGGSVTQVDADPRWVRGFYDDGVSDVLFYADMNNADTIRHILTKCVGKEGCKVTLSGKLVKDDTYGAKIVNAVISEP